MSNHLTGPGGNSTSSVKSFFKNVGSATVEFGKHLIICVESFYRYSIGKVVDYFSEKSKRLSEREASSKDGYLAATGSSIVRIGYGCQEKSQNMLNSFKKNTF